jgi:hypothetical protein
LCRSAIELGLCRRVRSHEVDDAPELDLREIAFSLAQRNACLRADHALVTAMDGGSRRRQLCLDLAGIKPGNYIALTDVDTLVYHHFGQTPGELAGDVDPLDLDPSISRANPAGTRFCVPSQ